MLREGQQFAHYRIVHRLRSGGMGEVYLAYDVQLHRHVAIKVIRSDFSHHPEDAAAQEIIRLFLREMHTIAQLEHRHILPIYDSGEESDNGAAFMYMVMPFRREGSLFDWLRKQGRLRVLSPEEVESIVTQAASALQYAHNHHIVHQDVKPSNFLVFGEAAHPAQLDLQLADFGVAKFMTITSKSFTIRGTPFYMAPEQWEGQTTSATDQYALAIMAYELLTGHLPFTGSNHQELWHQHHHVQPLPPCTINPHLPGELDPVLLRALAKNPQRRFRSISAFARAFRYAAFNTNPSPGEEKLSLIGTSSVEPTIPVRNASNTAANLPSQRKRAMLQFVVVLTFIAACLGFFFSISRSPQPPLVKTHVPVIPAKHTAIVGVTTVTASPEPTSTAQTTATVDQTAIAKNTATAQAYGTATAIANAIATPQAATATAYAATMAIGPLTLDDPLQNNNKGNNWDITPIAGGSGCAFLGGVYRSVIAQKGYFSTCFAQNTNFSNFSYQVQMTFVAGDQGGITFRANSGTGAFYYFQINRSGAYALQTYSNYTLSKTLTQGYSSAIQTGLNQPDLIGVIASDTTINLYVNMQLIASVNDSTLSVGQIGVVAESVQNPTAVAFNNAKVWVRS